MFNAIRRMIVKKVFSRREYTEDLLRKLWLRETGGWDWDEVVTTYEVETHRVKNMFDVLDERYGEEILSNSDDDAKNAMNKAILFMNCMTDEYNSEQEKKLLNEF